MQLQERAECNKFCAFWACEAGVYKKQMFGLGGWGMKLNLILTF